MKKNISKSLLYKSGIASLDQAFLSGLKFFNFYSLNKNRFKTRVWILFDLFLNHSIYGINPDSSNKYTACCFADY